MIRVTTDNPSALLAAIKEAIDDKKIDTWSYDTDGDFTHSVPQFNGHAWLRPKPQNDTLSFGIVDNTQIPLTQALFGIYQGRFIEMLIGHFPSAFTVISATPKLVNPPDVANKLS